MRWMGVQPPSAASHQPQRKCHTAFRAQSSKLATSPPNPTSRDGPGQQLLTTHAKGSIRLLVSYNPLAISTAHQHRQCPRTHTRHHASPDTPPTQATTPQHHHRRRRQSTSICLLAMQTRLYRHRQRDHARTAHRPDDTRTTTNCPLPIQPAALPQAS